MNESKNYVSAYSGQATSGRVLFADDDRAVQDIVSRFLKLKGFEVALADDGMEALAAFIEGSFDIVLTDFDMPVMDGLSLTLLIKEKSPGTPVILMTGSNAEVLEKVERMPFYSVVFKPFKIAELQKTIQGALTVI